MAHSATSPTRSSATRRPREYTQQPEGPRRNAARPKPDREPRYVGGVSSYLEVLDTERQRLTAEQQLAQAQRDVLTSLVRLYKSLGGGWE